MTNKATFCYIRTNLFEKALEMQLAFYFNWHFKEPVSVLTVEKADKGKLHHNPLKWNFHLAKLYIKVIERALTKTLFEQLQQVYGSCQWCKKYHMVSPIMNQGDSEKGIKMKEYQTVAAPGIWLWVGLQKRVPLHIRFSAFPRYRGQRL